MNWNKTIGYILLVIGLAIIAWTLWQSYAIFSDKASAPLVFKTQAEPTASGGNALDIQQQIDQAIQKQVGQILPAGTITKTLNLIAWTLLALILIWAGGVISGIGVRMIRS